MEVEEVSDNYPDNWKPINPDIDTTVLDHLEGDGVKIQCVNSSEFVVGRQTNFNCPVTIINCTNPPADVLAAGKPSDCRSEAEKEKIIIRDKVLSETAATAMQEIAKKNVSGESKPKLEGLGWCSLLATFLLRPYLKLPMGLWMTFVCLLAGLFIILGVMFLKPELLASKTQEFEYKPYKLYEKADWGGKPPKSTVLMKLPVPYVIISHSVTSKCKSLQTCTEILKNIQTYHLTLGHADISYNFLVDSAGNIYEGRGWNVRNIVAGFTNGRSIDINFLGDYSVDEKPTPEQLNAVKSFVEEGVKIGKIAEDYTLVAANSTFPTLSPGKNVYAEIAKWPHFDAEPQRHFKMFYDVGTKNTTKEEKLSKRHILFRKGDWGGEPPKSVIAMKLPVDYVVISHSVTPTCEDLVTCRPIIKSMQVYHFSIGHPDITFNFLVDLSGNMYVGRGWNAKNQLDGFVEGRNVDINFIGDYSKDLKPTESQLNAVKRFVEEGVKEGKISEDYVLVPANSTHNTLSPGKNVYKEIKNWTHFIQQSQN